ncbi:hypothetical protein PVA19_15230 [Agrobacterium sp. CNPSo 3708]|uniref:hypothetical protein n=1 Tax=Agrobacterium sp. CNPSo 3708 TaxID=3028150 RepID=UPI002363E6BD|nr:hypothetical protein [Agrobacterium sp. CNPSo 3708]MDD1499774.1 hypothetical protein [Agrobacterium sp. CNPSo 3708]
MTTTAPSTEDTRIARQMADLARERGSQTDKDLRAEGYSDDEIQRCSPLAAKMLRKNPSQISA